MMKDFNEKFQIEKLLIKQIGNWKISLRPKQVTLGSLILSLDRLCPTFSDLTEVEGRDLILAFREIELLFQKTFTPQKVNYLALMMVDEQVHYHVIPRYETDVVWNELVFKDKDWPKPPSILSTLELDEIKLDNLVGYFKSNL